MYWTALLSLFVFFICIICKFEEITDTINQNYTELNSKIVKIKNDKYYPRDDLNELEERYIKESRATWDTIRIIQEKVKQLEQSKL